MSEMGVNINTTAATYASAYSSTKKADSKPEETKDTDKNSSTGAVYEKDSDKKDKDKATYSINKMSAEKRAEIVKQMKQDAVNRQNQLVDIVNKTLFGQAKKFTEANDDFWSTMAKGGFSVDAAAKAKAQELISEDGYYGVKQTSQRIFDFASALAGDDVEKRCRLHLKRDINRQQNPGAKSFQISPRRHIRQLQTCLMIITILKK